MATLTDPMNRMPKHQAFEEDMEAARNVSYVLFGVLTVGISIGVIGFFCALSTVY